MILPNFKDSTVICPYCGCTTMFVQEQCHVTETIVNGKPTRYEKHAPKIVLICRECNAVVREYDTNKILETGE